MKRVAKKDERRANIGIGGHGEPYKLSSEEKKLAVRAAEAMGMGICGVDIMPSENGPVVIEINVNAQFKGLESATGKNVAREILKYVRGLHGEVDK